MKPIVIRHINRMFICDCCFLLVVGAGLVVMFQRISTELARQTTCKMKLKQIGLALLQYEDRHGTLPPATIFDFNGKPAHSWRVLILPFLGAEDIYQQYDFAEPWNGPKNSRLQSRLRVSGVSPYRCPSSALEGMMTNYVAITGPSTLWPDDGPGLDIDNVMQGEMPEVLVSEVPGAEVNWMEPKDFTVAAAVSKLTDDHGNRESIHANGVHFVDTAQNVRQIPRTTDRLILTKILTKSQRESN